VLALSDGLVAIVGIDQRHVESVSQIERDKTSRKASKDEIKQLVRMFVEGARRAVDAGIDGI
jgi:2,4-dienoyl-CoA reductase-like NADH-dependent reductase (Old Yellow Enzyme family)